MNAVELPVCPDCGAPVVARVCSRGKAAPSEKAAEAIAAVLVAVHRKLAHGVEFE